MDPIEMTMMLIVSTGDLGPQLREARLGGIQRRRQAWPPGPWQLTGSTGPSVITALVHDLQLLHARVQGRQGVDQAPGDVEARDQPVDDLESVERGDGRLARRCTSRNSR